MSYRDEMQALRLKNDELERENDALRRELDRHRPMAHEVDALRGIVRDQEREIVCRSAGRTWSTFLAVSVSLVVGTLTATFLLAQRVDHTHRVLERERHVARASFGSDALLHAVRAGDFEPIHREGRIRAVSGVDGLAEGDACTLDLFPGDGPFACRAEVRCGGRLLYGGGDLGYFECAKVDGRPTTGRDLRPTASDFDPMFVLDLPASRLLVEDGPDPRASVDISLDPR